MTDDLSIRSGDRDKANGTSRLLTHYAIAALAAGVGMLSLSQPAVGEVVVTHKTIPILIDSETGTLTPIDLNGDGINDISFGLTSFGPYGYTAEAFVVGQAGRGVVVNGRGPRFPLVSALRRGDTVGPAAHFSSAIPDAFLEQFAEKELRYSVCSKFTSYGHWAGNNPDRFVGLRFKIRGETHYGWVRVTVASEDFPGNCRRMNATITAYAYETVAGKAITIGSSKSAAERRDNLQGDTVTHSLGTLALGAPRFEIWRRE